MGTPSSLLLYYRKMSSTSSLDRTLNEIHTSLLDVVVVEDPRTTFTSRNPGRDLDDLVLHVKSF